MTTSLYSPSWYRVAGLKPRLRHHIEIHRHTYREEVWYVLQDHATGRLQRFTPTVYLLLGLMDGERTVQEIWEELRVALQEDAPTQEEVIRLLSQLHASDLMLCNVPPDTEELFKRFEKRRLTKLKQNLRNPLAMRFSLLDPERFLNRFKFIGRWIFSIPGAILWFIVVISGVAMAGFHWPELTENITDRILAPTNILLLWLTFPWIKAFHEFGHAFAIKRYGGEVHEMGIMFLVFTPIPYVDASSASAFRTKGERMLVGAAGMVIELFIAAIALFLWVNMEPGILRSILYNIIFIASVSSVLFNGNPLLRYDGYFILGDLLEIPNLGPRGLQYLGYLFQRYLFGLRDVEPPLSTRGERIWFVIYSVTSFFYRIFIYASIILFVASKFFIAGMVMALWAIFSMIILPVGKATKFLFTSPRLGKKRTKAILVTSALVSLILAAITLIPVPLGTQGEGVLWIPEQSFVRAGTEGMIDRVLKPSGVKVKKGEPLIECYDPFLLANIRVLESQLQGLKILYETQMLKDRVQAEITKDEIKHVKAELARSMERKEELIIKSPSDGTFYMPLAQDLPGRYVKRGELLGYILDPQIITIRVVVSQKDVDFVRLKTKEVKVRFSEKISAKLPAVLKREVPAATDQLPSRTLSREGGGEVPIDPRDRLGIKAFQKVFLFDVEVLENIGLYNVDGRVYVRFDHGREPLVWRWYRSIRQLFLRRFSV